MEAVIRPFKLDAVREALEKEKIHRMTVFEVKGAGRSMGSVVPANGKLSWFQDPKGSV
jgi:nitrogen regulatory protein PII